MTIIDFALLQKHCPNMISSMSESDLKSDQLSAILRLNNLDITKIDNLEIVSHISELYLSNNKIELIENIEFLSQLKLLDLSNNKITSKALKQTISRLPSSLETLILINNPCCSDEIILSEFQEYYPHLGIVVGIDESESDEDQSNDEETLDDNEAVEDVDQFNTNDDNFDPMKYNPLSADVILKQIVQRKCQRPDYQAHESNILDSISVRAFLLSFFHQ